MPNLKQSQLAAIELLNRRKARKSLIEFTKYTNDLYLPAAHHYLIADKLEKVASGEITRLMICMPPRHGKSELASRRFVPWYFGNHPSKQIIAACYNSDLASDFGREVRNIVASEEYQKLFETRLAADSKAAGKWHTDKNGIYLSCGIDSGATYLLP